MFKVNTHSKIKKKIKPQNFQQDITFSAKKQVITLLIF